MTILKPDITNIQRFMILPVVFSIVAIAFTIGSLGLNIGAILTSLIIMAVVLLPFVLFVLPTFLLEQNVIQGGTVTFGVVFLFIPLKRSIAIQDILVIEEKYRNDKKNEPTYMRFATGREDITISTKKYKRHELVAFIDTLKKKNPAIQVSYINNQR